MFVFVHIFLIRFNPYPYDVSVLVSIAISTFPEHFPIVPSLKRSFPTIYSAITCVMQVEALTNQEEVELRSKIEALGLEVTKVPSKSTQHLDEVVSSPRLGHNKSTHKLYTLSDKYL